MAKYQQKAIDSVRKQLKDLQMEAFTVMQNTSIQTDKNLSDYYEGKYSIYTDLITMYDTMIEEGVLEDD